MIEPLPDPPPGGFEILTADPPWQYRDNRNRKSAGMARSAYDVMTLADLASMRAEIDRVMAPRCALFMWATKPKMPTALALMEAWGFTYCTEPFTWLKLYPGRSAPFTPADFVAGLGHYTRSNAEKVLLGRRGPPFPRASKTVRELVFAPRGPHSEKPAVVRDRIVELMGDRPRLELFARGAPPPGWVFWGKETTACPIL